MWTAAIQAMIRDISRVDYQLEVKQWAVGGDCRREKTYMCDGGAFAAVCF